MSRFPGKERTSGPSPRVTPTPSMIRIAASDVPSVTSGSRSIGSAFKRVSRSRWNHHTAQTVPSRDDVSVQSQSSSVKRRWLTRGTKRNDRETSTVARVAPIENLGSSCSFRCGEESRDDGSPATFQRADDVSAASSRHRDYEKNLFSEQATSQQAPQKDQRTHDEQEVPVEETNVESLQPNVSAEKDKTPPDDASTSNSSVSVLSAFSLVTPPSQWIHKDSFLARRKKLEQWGIPISKEMKKITLQSIHEDPRKSEKLMQTEKRMLESTLNERLVWIKYKNKYWWPAVLYDNYRQLIQDELLQEHVWYRLPLLTSRIPLASLLVFNKQDRRNYAQVARLLGRGSANENGMGGTIELAEVEDWWPFKDESQIASIIEEMAFNGDYFRDHPTLYLDWHRAMDQVELLLCECLGLDRETLEEKLSESDDKELADQGSSDRFGSEKANCRRRSNNKRQVKAVAAALAAAPTCMVYLDDGDDDSDLGSNNHLDENSMVSSTAGGKSQVSATQKAQAMSMPNIQKRRTATWLQRAKEAEQKKVVRKCHDCSTQVLDIIEDFCLWKDNLVASAVDQPTWKEGKRLAKSMALTMNEEPVLAPKPTTATPPPSLPKKNLSLRLTDFCSGPDPSLYQAARKRNIQLVQQHDNGYDGNDADSYSTN